MSVNVATKARLHVGGLIVGNPTSDDPSDLTSAIGAVGTVRQYMGLIREVTIPAFTPGLIAATTTVDSAAQTLTGVAVGDILTLVMPAALEVGLMATAFVSAAGQVKIRFANVTTGGITPASRTYQLLYIAINHD